MIRTTLFTLVTGGFAGIAAPTAAAAQIVPDGNYLGSPERTEIYGADGVLVSRANVTLPIEVKAVFDSDFGTTTYFGAFAISKDYGYGYSIGANTQAAAQAIALANCLEVNDRCRIIAEILPEDYTAAQPGIITVSNEIAVYFLEARNYAAFRALAVSADGAYSMNWGHPDQQTADTEALADCEAYRITDQPMLTPMPCVVVPDLP